MGIVIALTILAIVIGFLGLLEGAVFAAALTILMGFIVGPYIVYGLYMSRGESENEQNSLAKETSRRKYLLLPIPWVLFAYFLILSIGYLVDSAYWLAFVGFFAMTTTLSLSGDSSNKEDIRNREYFLLLNRKQSFMLGVMGLAALFAFAVIMNAGLSASLRECVFLGVASGMLGAMSISLTLVTLFRN